jgi:hypothetical protein
MSVKLSARKKNSTSPLKRGSVSHINSRDYITLDKDLIRGVSQKEVEIEHLKTALYAVSTRLEVLKDMEKDVQNN